MKTSDFIEKWNDLRGQKGFLQRIDPLHPLNLFTGINESGFEQLVLITDVEPQLMKSSKALYVEKNKRKDGRWATQISSVDKSNKDVFARLCVDLVEVSSSSKNEVDGISSVTARFLSWQKLFAKIQDVLPKSVLKGLVGELFFAKYLFNKGIPKSDVINSWMGPNMADRDFVLNDRWFEIKSTSTGKETVTISSLNQLETDLKGTLVVLYLDSSSKTDSNAFSVADVISMIRVELRDMPAIGAIFEDKLMSIGYMDKSAYEEIFFVRGKTDYYLVNDTFPKLVTENIPTEIVGVRYDLSIAGIAPWKIGENDLWN